MRLVATGYGGPLPRSERINLTLDVDHAKGTSRAAQGVERSSDFTAAPTRGTDFFRSISLTAWSELARRNKLFVYWRPSLDLRGKSC